MCKKPCGTYQISIDAYYWQLQVGARTKPHQQFHMTLWKLLLHNNKQLIQKGEGWERKHFFTKYILTQEEQFQMKK